MLLNMKEYFINADGYKARVYTLNTVVVGTGAAGYNAADCLYRNGQKDIAIVTEGVKRGTSRNTGSDKQTYYKLTLSGGDADSVREMAQTLFDGQCVDGDLALCEAALSSQCFLKLVELGVPFPRNRYGEYIGYKTDHDPRRRAASIGPYTSKSMTEHLEQSAAEKQIKVFDRTQVIRFLMDEGKLLGLLCLDLDAKDNDTRFLVFHVKNVVYATGGPAGMYADSVYPNGHYGATGLAFEAGVNGKNLTEWQYGLASTAPRWNVSGTYMQVLPRFISTDENGGDEQEFLSDFFSDEGNMLDMIFLKGYQWPFDVRKVKDGSSIIDILVHIESSKGRKVYLDFRENPGRKPLDFSLLGTVTKDYLDKAGACFGTPIERLLHMNAPAVEFYKDRGVDLHTMPLEIALCAQHNNGGLDIDCWWQTNIEGIFAAGEVAASHGVYRPGGSALNAGQVGSARAARYIAAQRGGEPDTSFEDAAKSAVGWAVKTSEALLSGGEDNVRRLWDETGREMSMYGGAIRDDASIRKAAQRIGGMLERFDELVKVNNPGRLRLAFRLRDILISQRVYLLAMLDYREQGGKSRGSALYTDLAGEKPYSELPDIFTFSLDDGSRGNLIQLAKYDKNHEAVFSWRKVRPIPEDDDFFENVWREFRLNGNIF